MDTNAAVPPLTLAFNEIVLLVKRSGYKTAASLPDVLEFTAGEFRISLNTRRVEHRNSYGLLLPPVTALIEANDWALGYIDPSGGVLMASGEDQSTEDMLIAALRDTGSVAHKPLSTTSPTPEGAQ